VSLPQLTFGLNNPDADNTIYVSSNASDNDLTLVIGTTAAASFTPASTVVDESQAGTVTGSLLYLKLSPLNLTAAEFAAIKADAPGWQIVPFASEQVLGMTPTSALSLSPGSTFELKIGALADAGAQGSSASLTVDVYRVTPITVGNLVFPTHFSVALATPPHAGEQLSQDVDVDFLANEVVNTVSGYNTVENALTLAFYAGSRGRPVPASAATQFVLSFVYATDANGYGALCTPAQVQPPFGVKAGVNAGSWKITPQLGQQSPSWVIKPPAGEPIVGSGPYASVAILIQNLVTNFQPGPTVALLSYSGIEGYADGTFTLLINKQPHVQITSLSVTPDPAVLTDGAAEVEISWQVSDAGTMTLAPFSVDVTGKTSYRGVITDNTPITLTAQGVALANLGNVALANVTAKVLPVINSFVAQPQEMYAGDLPTAVELSWNVNTNEQLELISSQGPPDPNRYSAQGTVSKQINGPQMLTLLPLGQDKGDPVVQRSLILSAFTPQAASHSVPATYVAAPPNASMVLASDGSQVSAVDTIAYQPVSSGVPAGSGPAGMVFSADGSTLYVANSGDGTVSVISVAATGSAPQYTFTAASTVTVGGAPQRLALSPDGKYLYVSVDKGTDPGQLVVVRTGAQPAVVFSLNVGVAPRGVACMPSGAQIFVANSDANANSVTVIGRALNGVHSVVGTIGNLTGATDVAVSLDGSVLLVACAGANAVVAVDAVHPEAPRFSMPTGAGPVSVSLMPTGTYAVAANGGSNTVSLIAIGSSPNKCRVLTSTQLTGNPAEVAVTPDAGLVLVGTGSALSVITLATYQAAQTMPSVGGQPTGVAVSPDDSTVLAWHNALMTISRGKPSTGLFSYDVASQTVTPQLEDSQVVAFAFHPTASANTAFLVTKGGTAVEVYDTGSWSSTGSIPLEGGGQPVALACSADGSALFVLTVASDRSAILAGFALTSGYPTLTTLAARGAGGSPGSTLTLAVAPDASAVYLTDLGSGLLTVVKRHQDGGYAVSGNPIQVGTYPGASALSPDGRALYVACAGQLNGTLVRVETTSLHMDSVVLPSNAFTELVAMAVSPDGNRIFAVDQVAAGVRVLDAASLRLVQTLGWSSGAEMPNGIGVASDGSAVYTANIVSGNLGLLSQVQAGTGLHDAEQGYGGEGYGEQGNGEQGYVEQGYVEESVFRAGEVPRELSGAPAYQGLFLRDYVGQTPSSGNTTGAWTTCPDIWASGQALLPNPDQTLVQGYNTNTPPANTIYVSGAGEDNLVYVRGLNTVNGASTSRVWLYYVNGGGDPSLMLWPNNWMNQGVTQLNNSNTYIEVSSSALNEIDYTFPPFDWKAVPVNGHYCMIAWVEVPPISEPATDPRSGIGYIGTWNQLASFVQTHPNMGWLNTTDVPTPTNQTWTLNMALTGPPVGGLFKAGLQFTNIPTDASFSMSIVGPDSKGSITVPKTPVTSSGETYLVPLDWTGHDNFAGSALVTYYAGATPTPPGANIQTIAAANSTGLVGMVADPLIGAFRGKVYETGLVEGGFQQQWLTTVGMVQINLKPS
jgi:DNA-binding beta-propeller fold protein YncE